MKLSDKIKISYVVILASIVVLEVINLQFTGYIKKDSDKLARSEELLKQTSDLQKAVTRMESDFRSYFLLGDSSYVNSFYISVARFNEARKRYTADQITDSGQKALYDEIVNAVQDWKDSLLSPVLLARRDFLSKSSKKNRVEFDSLFNKVVAGQKEQAALEHIEALFNRFDTHERAAVQMNQQELRLSLSRSNTTSLVMAAYILVVGILITIATTRNITRRMNTMIDLAEKISLGQFNKKIQDDGQDEMGRLADALNRMTASLQENFMKLEAANQKLIANNRDLEQFMFTASHDLKEPVRMVSIYTQLLASKQSTHLSRESKEYIDFALEGSKRIVKLLDGLLYYLNLSAAGPYANVNLNDALASALQKLGPLVESSGAEVKCDKLPAIQGSYSQLETVFYNLVENAIKFSEGAPAMVTVKAVKQKEDWLFSVEDKGIGISHEYFEKIFFMFQRLKRDPVYDGTGIGLTIAKKIIEMHHGKIWVVSQPGKGSIFYFRLPEVQAAGEG